MDAWALNRLYRMKKINEHGDRTRLTVLQYPGLQDGTLLTNYIWGTFCETLKSHCRNLRSKSSRNCFRDTWARWAHVPNSQDEFK